jgi:hypothetical protein
MAWPPRGAKHHHAETSLGCVAFTERGATQMRSLDFNGWLGFLQFPSRSLPPRDRVCDPLVNNTKNNLKNRRDQWLRGRGCYVDIVSKNPWSLGKYAYSSFHVQVQAYLMR